LLIYIKPIFTFEKVPTEFDELLHQFTVSGFRVIALAGKHMDMTLYRAISLHRQVIESNLHFYGFLVMQNAIKPATHEVIQELTTAKIVCLMATGIWYELHSTA
jgi:cation-transporting ATPase 13A2